MTAPTAFWLAVALASWLVAGAALIAMAADRVRFNARLGNAFERGTAHGKLLQMHQASTERQRAADLGLRRKAEAREGARIDAMLVGDGSVQDDVGQRGLKNNNGG